MMSKTFVGIVFFTTPKLKRPKEPIRKDCQEDTVQHIRTQDFRQFCTGNKEQKIMELICVAKYLDSLLFNFMSSELTKTKDAKSRISEIVQMASDAANDNAGGTK